MENICYNCFRESLNENGVCTLCGFNGVKNREKYPMALPLGSILFGRYIVGRVLGQGGFGITYLAQDYQTKGLVAIKEFYPDTMVTRTGKTAVTPYAGERGENFGYGLVKFLEEAKTMAQFIGNPNITRVYSYFEENNTGYFVMEYLDGHSFQDYIKSHGGVISWEETMRVVLPVMDALEAMHNKGIIHRDVTPDNIYITNDGTVKLLDFGAARYSLGNVSRSLDVILKHGFAPKEQYSRHGKQGPFTDVYSLGATIYYAITGTKPDDAIERLEEDNTPLPTTLGARISDAQEDVVMQALAVMPADRYQNMYAFRAALIAVQPKPEWKPVWEPQPEPKPVPQPEPKPEPKPIPQPEPKPEPQPVPKPEPKPEPKEPKSGKSADSSGKPRKNWFKWLLPVAAVLTVLLGLGICMKPGYSKVMASAEDITTISRVMASAKDMTTISYAKRGDQPFWGQNKYRRKDVETVRFLDSLNNVPANAQDVSAARDRGVLAWMEGSTLYVAADGKISFNSNASWMFAYFTNLKEIDFGNCVNTANVTNMRDMFYGCENLTSLDLSGFDTANVTDMGLMFYGCENLASLDLSGFDTANVTDMGLMFYICKNLTSLDLSGFDTANVTNMGHMFWRCVNLTSLDLSGFDTSKVTSMVLMFYGCEKLTNLTCTNSRILAAYENR